MKKTLLSSLTALAILSTSALHADEIIDQMNTAIEAYKDKDYKGAMDELKFTIAQMQKLDDAENQKLLPSALDGWSMTIGDNGTQAAMSMLGGGGTSIEANYSKDNESINIQILANSPMISMMSMMINNPMIAQSDPSTEAYRYKRIKGIKKKDGSTTEITLLIVGQIILKLSGTNLKDDAVLEQYLDVIDIKKLKSSLL
ncbi:MAG: hypothetical protein Q9M36_06285 [Sulfurovum sp.]|nr:hypothetical protein [Sulfurovum sp.]